MTKIKVAKGWAVMSSDGRTFLSDTDMQLDVVDYAEPVVIVHGLTESEIHEAANLLAKSREVCEWAKHHWVVTNCKGIDFHSLFTFCPSCGRRVKISEGRGE